MSRLEQTLAGILLIIGLLVAGWCCVHAYGAHEYSAGHDAAVAERTAKDAVAILNRTAENAATAVTQTQTNSIITKVKNEELAPVRERIVTQRVYVGSAICGKGPAASPHAEGATGSDSADPSGRLVRQDVERDLVALKLAVEEDLATGRSCQAFLKKNNLEP